MPSWFARPLPWCRLRHWLTGAGSLSARLQAVCEHYAVQPVRQGSSPLRRNERSLLPACRGRTHAREVVLRCDGEPLVYARTVVDARHVRGPWRALRGLGTRPLGHMLFQDQALARQALQYRRVPPCSPWRRQMQRLWQAATGEALPPGTVWARRSRFSRHGAPLVIVELFSPRAAQRLPFRPRC